MSRWFIRSWKQQVLLIAVTFAISGWFTAMTAPGTWIDYLIVQSDPPPNVGMCLEKILDPKDDPR